MDTRVSNTVTKIAKKRKLTYSEIMSDSRRADLVDARNEAFVTLRDNYQMTFELIGYWFKKTHATVLHGYNKSKESIVFENRNILQKLIIKRESLIDELSKVDDAIIYFKDKYNR